MEFNYDTVYLMYFDSLAVYVLFAVLARAATIVTGYDP